HRWGGVLAIPRNWLPGVAFDRTTGIGTIGGYVGEGVAAANLAGRTLADLVAGEESPRTRLPWVGALGPRWEPEPLRWMAIRAVAGAGGAADRHEQRTGRPAGLSGRLFDWFASH
ncbi:MAG: FAD-dependent oxidoreductase, partial [Myxococcota bacterium]|nr:FAD-dependent oxidoreductase [Myxococcota bacterium]